MPLFRRLLLLSLVAAGSANARAAAQDLSSVHVCNQGRDAVYGFTSTPGEKHRWDVLGWIAIPPNECTNIWANNVPNVDPAYIGFGILGADGRVVSVSATVPSYGTDAKGNPTFSVTGTPFCVMPYPEHMAIFPADSDDDASHCGDWVNRKVADPKKNEYAAYKATLYFRPKLDCGLTGCGANTYYLDVKHEPGRQVVAVSRGKSPEEQGLALIGQFLNYLAESKRNSDAQQLQALQNRFARYKPGSAASWAEQWAKAPRVSPTNYASSAQMGDTAVFSGTIARYTVDQKRFPHWITIYLRESPDGAFVVCSPYPDMFQEVVGLDLNALVGKKLEVVGPLETAMCTPAGVRAGSVRVVESGMFHLK